MARRGAPTPQVWAAPPPRIPHCTGLLWPGLRPFGGHGLGASFFAISARSCAGVFARARAFCPPSIGMGCRKTQLTVPWRLQREQ